MNMGLPLKIFKTFAVYLVTFIYIFPLLWFCLAAFKTRAEIFANPPVFFPEFSFDNIIEAFLDTSHNLINSVIAGVGSTVLALLFAIPASYGFARYKLKGSGHIELWILSTKMMPPIAVIIPLYILFNKMGMFDTLFGLIMLYTAINIPFAVWMLTSFFRKLPHEIEDAARIDGCNLFQTIVLICLPLIKSGIAVVVIFSIIWTWNDLLFGLIMTQSEAKTLPVVISGHSGQTDTKWELMASLAFIQLIPIIIFTFFSQRHIVTGLTMGGVEK